MAIRRKHYFLSFLALVVLAVSIVLWAFLPIMAGYGAKTMCSCVYVMDRSPESVRQKELTIFPGLSSAAIDINRSDSSVTAKVLWKESKAIFRKGLGCTLLAERTESEVRNQKLVLADAPSQDQAALPWPAGDVIDQTIPEGVNLQQVQSAIDHAFEDEYPDKPIYTHAVVVVYKGKLIGEKYAQGFDKDSRMMGWSMTKSMTNALIGILVMDGKLKLDSPAPVAGWKQTEKKHITLNHLLQASSGLKWDESYFLPGDFHNMFTSSDDKGGYAANNKLADLPGTKFVYSSGTANLLSKIVRETVGDDDYYRFPYDRLFYKIGMRHALLEPDASGTFVGSSYGYASARDWARFGMLYLQDGAWLGERILPEGWAKYSGTPAPAAPKGEYGAHWWLNAGAKGNPEDCKYPGLPHDAMVADGFEFQHVVVIPSHDLVIVRLGVTHGTDSRLAQLVGGVIQGLPAQK